MNEPRSWYYADGEQTYGPLAAPEIEALIGQAIISPSTWIIVEGTEDWVLAQDSPFAPHFRNAPSQSGVREQSQADPAPDFVRDSLALPDEHEQPPEPRSSKFSQLGLAVLSEIKRSAQLASIKAAIEKLNHVDLTKAHYALGKKAYELKIEPDRLSDHYSEISRLEDTIKAKKEGSNADTNDTILDNFKGTASKAKSTVQAEALKIKRKQCLTKIGKEYRPSTIPIAAEDEFVAVEIIEGKIREKEAEFASICAECKSFLKLRYLVGNLMKTVWTRTMFARSDGPKHLDKGKSSFDGWQPAMTPEALGYNLPAVWRVFKTENGEEGMTERMPLTEGCNAPVSSACSQTFVDVIAGYFRSIFRRIDNTVRRIVPMPKRAIPRLLVYMVTLYLVFVIVRGVNEYFNDVAYNRRLSQMDSDLENTTYKWYGYGYYIGDWAAGKVNSGELQRSEATSGSEFRSLLRVTSQEERMAPRDFDACKSGYFDGLYGRPAKHAVRSEAP